LYEYQRKRLAKFAFHKLLIVKALRSGAFGLMMVVKERKWAQMLAPPPVFSLSVDSKGG
jgi:hypothetical protein